MGHSILAALLTCAALTGCSQDGTPAAAPAEPEPQAAPAPAAPAPKADAPPDPCTYAGARTIALEAGVLTTTPWGLELTYAIDEDDKRGPGFMFLLRHGDRRWETRRDNSNWTAEMTWRGFCWRGGARPDKRAARVQIEMAPVCKDGKLITLGGCGDALASER
jgi:hypothetical protein